MRCACRNQMSSRAGRRPLKARRREGLLGRALVRLPAPPGCELRFCKFCLCCWASGRRKSRADGPQQAHCAPPGILLKRVKFLPPTLQPAPFAMAQRQASGGCSPPPADLLHSAGTFQWTWTKPAAREVASAAFVLTLGIVGKCVGHRVRLGGDMGGSGWQTAAAGATSRPLPCGPPLTPPPFPVQCHSARAFCFLHHGSGGGRAGVCCHSSGQHVSSRGSAPRVWG